MKNLLLSIVVILLSILSLSAQYGEISGRVTDLSGEGVSFATISCDINGGLQGTLTDYDGYYSIKPMLPGSYNLKYEYLGMNTHEEKNVIVVEGRITTVDVVMLENETQLDEVIIESIKIPIASRDMAQTGYMISSNSENRKTKSSATNGNNKLQPSLSNHNQYKAYTLSPQGQSSNSSIETKEVITNLSHCSVASTCLYIEGMKVRGSTSVPPQKAEICDDQLTGTPASQPNPKDVTTKMLPELLFVEAKKTPVATIKIDNDYATESYKLITENEFRDVSLNPLSTFGIDVDRAAYSNMRRFIDQQQRPPADALRIEELVNYFYYNYPKPNGDNPIAISQELSDCPWNPESLILRVALAAKELDVQNLPPSNLVFLIDVSGSMTNINKLPLVQQSLKLLVQQLRPQDRVSLVVYAGSAGLVLPATSAAEKDKILEAINRLQAGGSTAGGAGIELAYKTAKENFIADGNNRVILATDGDFNVGIAQPNELQRMIEEKRKEGIFLTCLGFGMGNYKDDRLELLADKGNGNYAYIDNISEAKKMLIREFGATIYTVAKDVKAQIEFNPALVHSYRLIGYENRLLNEEDFVDDTKDGGEMGSGHTVTILYEIIPQRQTTENGANTPPLKYSKKHLVNKIGNKHELATIKFRYKEPNELISKEISQVIPYDVLAFSNASDDHRFASSVAMFGLIMIHSKYIRGHKLEDVIKLASHAQSNDKDGYRAEFISLVNKAKQIIRSE